MSLKTFKPYTKSQRSTVLVDKSNLWKGKPYKALTKNKRASKGRNNMGRITSRNSGGGHKQKYRQVDFYRKKINMTFDYISRPTFLHENRVFDIWRRNNYKTSRLE